MTIKGALKVAAINTLSCCRWKALALVHNDRSSSWSQVLGLGTMDETDTIMDTGILLGMFDTGGPWLAYKTPGNDISGWVGAGNQIFDFLVSKVIFWNLNIEKDIFGGLETHLSLHWQTVGQAKSC